MNLDEPTSFWRYGHYGGANPFFRFFYQLIYGSGHIYGPVSQKSIRFLTQRYVPCNAVLLGFCFFCHFLFSPFFPLWPCLANYGHTFGYPNFRVQADIKRWYPKMAKI